MIGFMLVIGLFLIGLSNDIDRLSGEGFRSTGRRRATVRGRRARWKSPPPPRPRYKPRALDAKTIAEAFQLTAEDMPDQPAIRTKGDELLDHLGGVRAAGREDRGAASPALGLGRGDTVAIMLTNRPEFHSVDSAAMHLGATPFSIYNTYTPDQIEYLVERRREARSSSPSRRSSTPC